MSQPKGKKLMGLKSSSIEIEEIKKSKSKGPVINATGDVAEAIKGYIEGKDLIKQGEALVSLHRSTIEEKGRETFVENLIETGKKESIKLVTKQNETMLYIVQDKFSKIVFDEEAELSSFKKQLSSIVGKDGVEELIVESQTFTINSAALENDKIVGELEKFAQQIKSKYGVSLLQYKEVVEVKKGSLENLRSYTRLASKMRKLIDLLKPVVQLRGT